MDLFKPKISEDKFHPNFHSLLNSAHHRQAKFLMNQLAARMGDPNGNFIRDFQSKGLHSRLFELACFAYLESDGWSIDRSHKRPDFIAFKGEAGIALEATTASPPDGANPDISISKLDYLTEEEICRKVSLEFPKRIKAILKNKLTHRYHQLSHCKERPFVLLVAPYFEPGSVTYTDDALTRCLYGLGGIDDGKPPFFTWTDASAVSAVIFSNQFTVPRFYRISTECYGIADQTVIRDGMAYISTSKDDYQLLPYEFYVGSPAAPKETWSQGVTIFHNPNAINPLSDHLLPHTSSFSILNGEMIRKVHGFHPVTSLMRIQVA